MRPQLAGSGLAALLMMLVSVVMHGSAAWQMRRSTSEQKRHRPPQSLETSLTRRAVPRTGTRSAHVSRLIERIARPHQPLDEYLRLGMIRIIPNGNQCCFHNALFVSNLSYPSLDPKNRISICAT
jgi:hypothetical protein